jgi:hypothetical protein
MFDIKRAEQEAVQWGISLVDRMELQIQINGKVDVFGDPDLDDDTEERFREIVADILISHKLASKGNRFLQCSRYAHLYKCKGPSEHKLFSPIYCDLRFCPRCAPRQFARLMKKYEPIVEKIYALRQPDFRFRSITFTSRNTGFLTPSQVKQFNTAVKRTLRKLMKKFKAWGALWCNEVGFNNTNLHAHVLFYGPYIAQSELAKIWNEISGHEVVWITEAKGKGKLTLLYMLKYVSKPPTDDPRQIGLLEVAFHKTRRVHTLGIFYNFAGKDADAEYSEWTVCPHCGEKIEKEPGCPRIEKAISEYRTFVGTTNTERRRHWVN